MTYLVFFNVFPTYSEKASWEGCGGGIGSQKEGANINKSLVALSNVISALGKYFNLLAYSFLLGSFLLGKFKYRHTES